MKIVPIDKSKLAKTDQEYFDLVNGKADWIVRTADDVRQLRQAGDGPLAKLAESDFQEFLTRLQFKNGGVAGGYYKPLMSSLSLTEIFEVFERFGMSRDWLLSRDRIICVGNHCEESDHGFCSSHCHAQ